MSPNFNQNDQSQGSLDLSLDLHLHRSNATLFKQSLISYLKHCLLGPLPEGDLLANGGLFRFPSSSNLEEESDREL